MLVVLNISYSLIKITIWTDARCGKTVLDLAQELFDYWHSILIYYYTFHLERLYLNIPLVGSDVVYIYSFSWIGI